VKIIRTAYRFCGLKEIASVTLLSAGLATVCVAAEFDCVIEPRQVLEIRSTLEGVVERVGAERGDLVRKGQKLAVIDSRVDRAQAAIEKQRSEMWGATHAAESKVALGVKKLRRAQELQRQNFVTDQARDEALSDKELAESELMVANDNRRLAKLELQRQEELVRQKTIRSPINGVVMERLINPGELAEAGVGRKAIMKLAEIDVLNVDVLLPAQAYGQVNIGMGVDVIPEIPASTHHQATLKVIDRVLDAASGTFGVRLELPNPQQKLPAGIRCKAKFLDLSVKSAARQSDSPKPRSPLAVKATQSIVMGH